MRDSDWTELALIRADRSARDILKNLPKEGQTALVDNASKLSKQVSKYGLECSVVLLCNYQNMIALDFTTSPGNTNGTTKRIPSSTSGLMVQHSLTRGS